MTRGSWVVDWIGKRGEDMYVAKHIDDFGDDEAQAKRYAEDVGGVAFFRCESDGPWREGEVA